MIQNLPEIIIGLGIVNWIIILIFKKKSKIPLESFSLVACLSLICMLTYNFSAITNKFDMFIKMFTLIIILGIFYFIPSYKKQNDTYKLLVNISLFGTLSIISANNFLSMFIAVELSTIPFYFIIYNENNLKKEPTYFIYMLFSSCLEIFAISLIYASSKSVDFLEIGYTFVNPKLLSLGLIILFLAFCIKFAMIPFSKWVVDIFDDKDICTLSFILLISKCSIFFVMLKIFQMISCSSIDFIIPVNILIGISIVISSLLVVYQNNLKKMLAYITIEHGSLICAGAISITDQAFINTIILIFADILSLYGVFIFLDAISNQVKSIKLLENLSNISINSTNLKLALTVIIISLAGIPPTLCFWGKYYVTLSIIADGNYFLTVCVCISMIFSGIYAIKILKNIWNKKNHATNIEILINDKILYIVAILQIILPLAINYIHQN